jgi:uncharacterized protein YebE (UPF0316 family)
MAYFFSFTLTWQMVGGALIIFFLRILDMSMETLRMIFTMRDKNILVWVIGFIRSVIFILVFASVLENLDNILNLVAYSAGFATGNVVGMWLEKRLAIGFAEVRVISSKWGSAIMDALRECDYAVTEIPARGKDGMVTVLTCSVLRKNVPEVKTLVRSVDEEAFITTEDIYSVRRGFWRA